MDRATAAGGGGEDPHPPRAARRATAPIAGAHARVAPGCARRSRSRRPRRRPLAGLTTHRRPPSIRLHDSTGDAGLRPRHAPTTRFRRLTPLRRAAYRNRRGAQRRKHPLDRRGVCRITGVPSTTPACPGYAHWTGAVHLLRGQCVAGLPLGMCPCRSTAGRESPACTRRSARGKIRRRAR